MTEGPSIGAARVYDEPAPGEGARILVDRLWPRGIRKDDPRIGRWLRDVAPSTELRHWYGHNPELFAQFEARYRRELAERPEQGAALADLRAAAAAGPITLVTATRELDLSHVPVLAAILRESAATVEP